MLLLLLVPKPILCVLMYCFVIRGQQQQLTLELILMYILVLFYLFLSITWIPLSKNEKSVMKNSAALPSAAKGKVKGTLKDNVNNDITQQYFLHFFESFVIVEGC